MCTSFGSLCVSPGRLGNIYAPVNYSIGAMHLPAHSVVNVRFMLSLHVPMHNIICMRAHETQLLFSVIVAFDMHCT